MMLSCDSTDGTIIVNIKDIRFVVSDPNHPETVMLHVKGGHAFEVRGTLDQFRRIFNIESSYYDGGVLKL